VAKRRYYRSPLYFAARTAAALAGLLPRSWAAAFAAAAGKAAFVLARRHRQQALENLRRVYGAEKSEQQIRGLAGKVFENLAETAVELLGFPKLRREDLNHRVETGDAFRIYDDLLSEGKGLISVTAHLGNWELLAGVFGLKGYPGAVLARRIYDDRYNRWIVGLRASVNVSTIDRDRSAREIVRLLKKNAIVGLLPDQDLDGLRGIFVPFFGHPAYTPAAPVKISLATGAPIVSNFLIRLPDRRHRLVIGKVIRPHIATTREEAIDRYTSEWMQDFERMIRQYPEQWAWMHNRWKTRPGPKAKAYDRELCV